MRKENGNLPSVKNFRDKYKGLVSGVGWEVVYEKAFPCFMKPRIFPPNGQYCLMLS